MQSEKPNTHSSSTDKRTFSWNFKWDGGNKSFGDKKNEKIFFIGTALMGLFYLYLLQLSNQPLEITWKEFVTK